MAYFSRPRPGSGPSEKADPRPLDPIHGPYTKIHCMS